MESGASFTTLDFEGGERFVALRRQLGVESFGLNLMLLEPGQRGRVHRHQRQEEVYIVLEGTLTIELEGGETHTLTPVTQFGGGGIVEPLNEILFGTPTPPTFFFPPLNFVDAGQTTTIGPDLLTPGTHLFMCIIHPWMEETVTVTG